MPNLLHRVPLMTTERTVRPGGVPVVLRGYQPVAWVRLVPWGGRPGPRAVPFPAVLDTGHNHSFLIPSSLFEAWTGESPDGLITYRVVPANGVSVGCYGFNVEVFGMRAGEPTERVVGRLETDRGVAIIPPEHEGRFPRLPVIGVRALCASRVTLTVDGDGRTYTLKAPAAPGR